MNEDKSNDNYGEHFKSHVILYYEDLQAIVSILNEVSKDVRIKYDDKEFDNLEEITVLGKERLKSLEISAWKPYISLNLEEDNIWLYINDKTSDQIRLFNEIKRFLKNRPNKLDESLPSQTLKIIGIISIVLLLGSIKEFQEATVPERVFYIMFGISSTFAILGIWLFRFEKNYIYTLQKREVESPIKKFAKIVLFSIVLGIIAMIVAILFKS